MLAYSFIDPSEPFGIPPRQLNGGLFTGEAFVENSGWKNIPVLPDADTYCTQNLQSANPPPQGSLAIPGHTRPGNNAQPLTAYRFYNQTMYKNLKCSQ